MVGHGDLHLVAGDADPHRGRGARGRVPPYVGEQVVEDLAQAHRVAAHHGFVRRLQVDRPVGFDGAGAGHGVGREPGQVDRFAFEGASLVEPGQEEELVDDAPVKQELMELQMQLELGDITDDEYVEREAALMVRLREVRAWRERLGKGTSGGPVRVAKAADEE